jgi:hypothetical protein
MSEGRFGALKGGRLLLWGFLLLLSLLFLGRCFAVFRSPSFLAESESTAAAASKLVLGDAKILIIREI